MVCKVNGNGVFVGISSMLVIASSSKWEKILITFVRNENTDIPLYCLFEEGIL